LLDAAQLRAAEALPNDPVEAARNFREAFRHARALGDPKHAAAQLTGVAIAYSLLGRRRAAIRVLELATKYAPQWDTPQGLLGTEYEAQAEAEVGRGAISKAKLSLSKAAFHLQLASDLAVRAGADDSSASVKDPRARARACVERARQLITRSS
jgi:hypothetical protein